MVRRDVFGFRLSCDCDDAAAPVMGLKENFAKISTVATVAAAPIVAQATEGTNEIFGIDDPRIYGILPVLVAINVLFLEWAKEQDDEDFFDALPPPPKKRGDL